MISAKAQVLTRSQFRGWVTAYKLPPGAIDELEATIEAGGFAPEPLSEAELHCWLYGREVVGALFGEDDLGRAFRKLNQVGPLGIEVSNTVEGGWSVDAPSYGELYCHNETSLARTIAAIAYLKTHPEADVSDLVGDEVLS